MEIISTTADLKLYHSMPGIEDAVVGFVPTMGALHNGHLSLVDVAARFSDYVIVSIFVNPTQFNDPDDLKNYPRNLEKDIELLNNQGKTSVVFVPSIEEIYPEQDTRIFNFGNLDKVMEGAHRPGHFNGVAQVVSKLFEIVEPQKAFFGQKDFQQLAIIRQLVKQMDSEIEIISCPIIREKDGLAMSSRNQLLSPEERIQAANISKILFKSMEIAKSLDVNMLSNWVINEINNNSFLQVEYFQVVDSITLMPVEKWSQPGEKQGCIAVKVGKVRLIDNIKFT
jgi:pantoate--beta-alanine ligase